jgi:hypothetical protein
LVAFRFDAFSCREPVSASLENVMDALAFGALTIALSSSIADSIFS